MRRFLLLTIAMPITIGGLTACQSPRYKEFPQVKQGMQKDLVLEAAGNPKVSRRWHGKDRWIYEYTQTPDGPQTREVHFEDGKAVYVGTKVVPAVTADEQDRINEEANKAAEAEESRQRSGYEAYFGVARSRSFSPASTEGANPYTTYSKEELRMMESMYGNEEATAELQKRTPKKFESVE